jgi:hypothetical protein
MAEQFDALDALCAVSIKVNRLDSLEQRADEDDGLDDSLSSDLVASKASFVCKLLEMLTQGEVETAVSGSVNMVRWGRDGRTVIIVDPSAFSQTMLPRYFKHRYTLRFRFVVTLESSRHYFNHA